MNNLFRNVVAVVAGIVIGGFVNMGLVNLGPFVIRLPEGADVSTMDGLRESMKLFSPANFLFPFLGHALGTLAGAFVAAKIAVSHKKNIALGIGVFYLLGGIAAVYAFGGPLWFKVLDLVVAYIPMGLLGGKLAGGNPQQTTKA